MNRELKSFTQIHQLLVQEVRQHTGGAKLRPMLVPPAQRDETGCNWRVDAWSGPRKLLDDLHAQLASVSEHFQRRYNAIGRAPQTANPRDWR